MRLDHQILTDQGVFYPQALYNNLAFELTLAEAKHVVRGSDATKLVYKLKNIQLEYEMIRSKALADEARSVYASGKEFLYDQFHRERAVTYGRNTDATMTIKINPQRRSLAAVLLPFMDTHTTGVTDSEKVFNPDITKVKLTVNGVPNRLNNEGLETTDLLEAASGFFVKKRNKTQHLNAHKFYTDDKFSLLIDLCSMDAQDMHGSGTRLVNTQDGVQIELERTTSGSANFICHICTISDSQMNMGQQLESGQF